jgi:hypothetical protein
VLDAAAVLVALKTTGTAYQKRFGNQPCWGRKLSMSLKAVQESLQVCRCGKEPKHSCCQPKLKRQHTGMSVPGTTAHLARPHQSSHQSGVQCAQVLAVAALEVEERAP